MSSLIVIKKPKDPASEAFRTLRTNIHYSSLDKDIRVIAVTSAGPGEGKSTISSNLAAAVAQSGKKVLLIDSDLRRPSIHKVFGISNKIGLSNLLIEGLKVGDVALKSAANLDVLTAGTIPPNPSEILISKKLSSFLEEMKVQYDTIVIDTPPVAVVTDAQILATKADGVLLVVSQSQATIDAVKKAKELLVSVNANILGVVLNKVEQKSDQMYSYYYYGHDDKKTERKKKRSVK